MKRPGAAHSGGARAALILAMALTAAALVAPAARAVAPQADYQVATLSGGLRSAKQRLPRRGGGFSGPGRAVGRRLERRPPIERAALASGPQRLDAVRGAAPSARQLGASAQRDIGSGKRGRGLNASGPQPAAPVLGFAWDGLDQSNCPECSPADASMAVGPDEVVTAVNTVWAAYERDGTPVVPEMQFADFFLDVYDDPEAVFYSPKVLFDQFHGRFVLIVLATDFGFQDSRVLVAVSAPGTATGVWDLHSIDATLNGGTIRTTNYIFNPGLGVDSRAIYLTGDMFSFGSDSFRYAKLIVLDKAQLYGGTLRGAVIWDIIDAFHERAVGIQPAHHFGPHSAGYLAAVRFPAGDVVRGMTVWQVSGRLNRPKLYRRLASTDFFAEPPPALQPPDIDNTRLDTGDGRLQNLVFRGGILTAAHATGIDWGDFQVVSAIHYVQISTSRWRRVSELYYGAEEVDYSYPAIMSNAFGDLALLFNSSSQDEYASLRFTGRHAFDAGSFLHPSEEVAAGAGQLLEGDGQIAYLGVYNGAAVDPSDPSIIWLFGSYARAEDFWGTAAAEVGF